MRLSTIIKRNGRGMCKWCDSAGQCGKSRKCAKSKCGKAKAHTFIQRELNFFGKYEILESIKTNKNASDEI